MRVVIAPDSFKGSLSADRVARALVEGLASCDEPPWSNAAYECVAMADGGEGTARAMVEATGGRMESRRVVGPLGEPVDARFGILGDGETAVIEMAEASGLTLVPEGERDPGRTTTFGTGQLMRAALDLGCRHLIVAIGGSATNDGGAGMAEALGVRFLDEEGRPVPRGGAGLLKLTRIDTSQSDPRLAEVKVTVACDVDNPLIGPEGASRVFGPQKGADEAMVELLDAALTRYAQIIRRDLGVKVADVPGAGAAGGLGAGLIAFCQATLRPGFEIVSEFVGLERRIAGAQLVITGEGRIDGQTARGKVAAGVGRLARRLGVPVIACAGSVTDDALNLVPEVLDALYPILPGPASLADAMERAEHYIRAAGHRLARLLAVGARLDYGGSSNVWKDH